MRSFNTIVKIDCKLRFRRDSDGLTQHASMKDISDFKAWYHTIAMRGNETDEFRLVLTEPTTKLYWERLLMRAMMCGTATCLPLYLYVDEADCERISESIFGSLYELGRWIISDNVQVSRVKTLHI